MKKNCTHTYVSTSIATGQGMYYFINKNKNQTKSLTRPTEYTFNREYFRNVRIVKPNAIWCIVYQTRINRYGANVRKTLSTGFFCHVPSAVQNAIVGRRWRHRPRRRELRGVYQLLRSGRFRFRLDDVVAIIAHSVFVFFFGGEGGPIGQLRWIIAVSRFNRVKIIFIIICTIFRLRLERDIGCTANTRRCVQTSE